MITFLTFFLGLTTGLHTVDLAVDRTVAVVELRLDGEALGVVKGEPWKLVCDFGLDLRPHLLEAVAFDDAGRELGRIEQRVNLPKPAVIAAIALRDYRDGRYEAADLVWRTVDEEEPEQIVAMFDAAPIAVEEGRSIRLPAYDPRRIHILSVEVLFSEERRAQADLAFGGQYGEEVSTELSAVAIELTAGRKTPTVEELRGHILVGGRPARVVAVEDERADVFVVRERSSIPKLRDVWTEAWQAASSNSRRRFGGGGTAAQFLDSALRRNDSLTYVLTTPRNVEAADGRGVTGVFPVYGNLNMKKNGGMGNILTSLHPEVGTLSRGQRVGSAVALAGVKAAGSNRPRAVVLVLGDDFADGSSYEPANVTRYLDMLRVPLHVWRLNDSEGLLSEWGTGLPIASLKDFNGAMKELKRRLARQFVVWIDGVHLPREISLSVAIQDRMRLASSDPLPR